MALKFSLVDTWSDGTRLHVSGTIDATGDYPKGGDRLDLSGVPRIGAIESVRTAWIDSAGAGYDYHFYPATERGMGLVKIIAARTEEELAEGPYPENVKNETITLYGIFRLSEVKP